MVASSLSVPLGVDSILLSLPNVRSPFRNRVAMVLDCDFGRDEGAGAEEGKGGADSAIGETGAVGSVVGNEERARLSREAEEDMVSVLGWKKDV